MRYALPLIGILLAMYLVNNLASYALCYTTQRTRYSSFVTRDQVAQGCIYRLTFPFGF